MKFEVLDLSLRSLVQHYFSKSRTLRHFRLRSYPYKLAVLWGVNETCPEPISRVSANTEVNLDSVLFPKSQLNGTCYIFVPFSKPLKSNSVKLSQSK